MKGSLKYLCLALKASCDYFPRVRYQKRFLTKSGDVIVIKTPDQLVNIIQTNGNQWESGNLEKISII